MTDFPFAIVGFDLDGTLLDTSADLAAALNHALAVIDRPPLEVDQVKPLIGGGAKMMLEFGLTATGGVPATGFARLHEALLRHYEENISVHTCPFPGGEAALDALDARGVQYAIVTNKSERLAIKILAELGLMERMRCVIGGDTLGRENAKPSAAPIHEMIRRCGGGRAAFVGDSIFDTEAARNAGIPSVACSFGFLMQPIEELQAHAVIDHFDALIPTLQRLG